MSAIRYIKLLLTNADFKKFLSVNDFNLKPHVQTEIFDFPLILDRDTCRVDSPQSL